MTSNPAQHVKHVCSAVVLVIVQFTFSSPICRTIFAILQMNLQDANFKTRLHLNFVLGQDAAQKGKIPRRVIVPLDTLLNSTDTVVAPVDRKTKGEGRTVLLLI